LGEGGRRQDQEDGRADEQLFRHDLAPAAPRIGVNLRAGALVAGQDA
jgi:hypothetical protein